MNYPESAQILEEIKKAKTILVNCHRSPDPDSVGSALAMRSVLTGMGKSVEVICPDQVQDDSKFLVDSGVVQKIDYDTFDFNKYDLFIILDSSEWSQVLGKGKNKIPEINKIVIDHHFTNSGFGEINLIDRKRSSTSEVLYGLFLDWGILINKVIAEYLLTGIIYDTSCLQHSSADARTAKIFEELYSLGADKNKIVLNLFRNIDFENVRLMGEILRNLKVDSDYGFVWSAVPYETFSLYPDTTGVKSMAATLFASSIKNSNFGVIMIEEKKDSLNMSFRAKEGYDISEAAKAVGGGGHKQAGAAMLTGLPFNDAVGKVLEACRKYAKKG